MKCWPRNIGGKGGFFEVPAVLEMSKPGQSQSVGDGSCSGGLRRKKGGPHRRSQPRHMRLRSWAGQCPGKVWGRAAGGQLFPGCEYGRCGYGRQPALAALFTHGKLPVPPPPSQSLCR
jgi:hypothetical protein